MSTQGQNFGWNRSDCDETFKQDMYMLCDKKYGRKKRWIFLLASKIKRCKFLADLYYKSVRIFCRFYWSNLSENLGILSSLSDIKNVTYLNFQLANTSNWNTCSMISERLDVAQSEIKDCSRAYVHVFNGLFIFDVLS